MKMLEIIEYVESYSVEELMKLGLQHYFETDENDLSNLTCRYKTHEFRRIVEPIDYFEKSITDIKNNIQEYKWLYSLLNDEQSRLVLEHMLTAKLTFDTNEIEKAFSMEQIYFDKKIWGKLENEYYVDCGAFRGDTIIQFAVNCPDFAKIYAFEAVPEIMKDCQSEVQELAAVLPDTISFYTNAVSDKKKKLYFDIGMMQGESKASSQGDVEVEAVALDEVITSTVSFIKMDIEGSELEAIQGAKKIIQEYTPKMAICIYHKCDDFWKIPKQIMEYNSDYRYVIRQHNSEVYSETVLYCIPRSKISKDDSSKISSRDKELRFSCAMNKINFFTEYEAKKLFEFINTRKWYLRMLMHSNFELQSLSNSNATLKKWVDEIQDAKEWLEQQSDAKEKYISELLSAKEWLEQQAVDQKQYIAELTDAKEWLEQQSDAKEKYISELLLAKEWLEQQAVDQKTYIEELINAKKWLEQQSNEKEKCIVELVDAKQWLEEQNEIKVNETEKLGLNIAKLEQRISQLENENSKLNYRLNVLKEDKMIQKVIKVKKYQV